MGRSYNHWSEEEVSSLKEGVARFGVGNWQKIVNDYPVLRQRTGVQLKDKYRNMIKFRHCLPAEVPPPRRRSAGAAAASSQQRSSPVTSKGFAAATSQPQQEVQQQQAGQAQQQQEVQQQQVTVPAPVLAPAPAAAAPALPTLSIPQPLPVLPPPPVPQPPPMAQPLRSTGQSQAQAGPTSAQRQAQIAADQSHTQQRLRAAQAALMPARQAYIQQLAAASVRRGAAAAAMDEAAEAAAAKNGAGPQVQGLMHVADWWSQQAALAQQLLLATRQMYLQAAEEAQQAQAAANAAATAMLQAAESAADSMAPHGALPTSSAAGLAGLAGGGGSGGDGAPAVRHSNRRKAALNRKRFLDEDGAEELDPPAPPTRPTSAMSGPAGAAAAVGGYLEMIEEGPGGAGSSGGGGKRRKTGAQKRLHEDTRFGIYDDRRYRNAVPPLQPRRHSTSFSTGTSSQGGGGGGGALAARLAPLVTLPSRGNGAAVNGAARGVPRQQRRRRRRRPRRLAGEFAGEEEDEDEEFDEDDARMADAELAEADEEEDEWQRQMRHEQHDVDCVCGVTYDDGGEMVECEACGVWAHTACLARFGRLRPGANRHLCTNCQQGFGSPLAGGTPTAAAAAALAAGALSPRGIAVALAARRQAFRNVDRAMSHGNEELYDIAAFLDNMGPGQDRGHQQEAEGQAAEQSMMGGGEEGEGEGEAGGEEAGCKQRRRREPGGPPVPAWGGCGQRRQRTRRQTAGPAGTGQHPWPSGGVTEALPTVRRRHRLPPHPGMPSPLAVWHHWQQRQAGFPPPFMAAGAHLPSGLMSRLSGLQHSPSQHPGGLPPLPPFLSFGGTTLALPGDPPLASAARTASAMAAAAAAAAAMSLGGGPWLGLPGSDGEHGGQEDEDGDQSLDGKAAAVAELMQIMHGGGSHGLGLPPHAPRAMLPAAAASALLSSRRPTPSPPIDLMHRSDLHDADLQDDLHAQDWLQAAASLARADSHPQYHSFPTAGLDSAVGVGPSSSQHLASLGGSPARLPPLPPLPTLGLQEHQQQWMAAMGALQHPQQPQQQQAQQRGSAGKGELPAVAAAGAGAGKGFSMRPLVPGPGQEPQLSSVHQRLQQLSEGVGAAAAAAASTGCAPSRRQSGGGLSALDAAQQLDGFGRYRQGSLHSLQQLAPDLGDGLHLTPTASTRAEALLCDDDGDAEGPQLLMSAVQQVEEEEQQELAAAAAAAAAVAVAAAGVQEQQQQPQLQQQQQQQQIPHETQPGPLAQLAV